MSNRTTKRTRRVDLGVDWYLPGKKRRFTTTTAASSYLIETLAPGRTWAQVAEAILFDDEAKGVAEAFVAAGLGDEPAADFLGGTDRS